MFLVIFKEEVEGEDYMHVSEELTREDVHFLKNGWVDIVNCDDGTRLNVEGDWENIPSSEESENVEKYRYSS